MAYLQPDIFASSISLEVEWNDLQVGAGLHIVAAVTESCVTGLNDDDLRRATMMG